MRFNSAKRGFTPNEILLTRRPKRFRRGFTLMEVMFAAAIMLVAIGGLLGTYVLCFNLNETAKNLSLATNIIQQKFEEIRDHNFYEIDNDYDGTVFDIPGLSNQDAKGAIDVEDLAPDLLRVTVSVCWRQREGRIIGEDNGRGGGIALNGRLEGSEDINGNGIVDSPALISEVVTNR
jgi:prepilin-type N-terminal cleavage/methylation domain-containing protein